MVIYDKYRGNEANVRFNSDDFSDTEIGYDIKDKCYYAHINIHKITSHYLKNEFKMFSDCKWKLWDESDKLEKFIEILEANNK